MHAIDPMAIIQVPSEVDSALDQAERSVAATGHALLAGNPEQLQSTSRDLHDSAHALALVLRGAGSGEVMREAMRERLLRVARDIAMQREALLRRSAAVDRSVQSLLPQSQPGTYGSALGRYASRNMSGPAFFGSF